MLGNKEMLYTGEHCGAKPERMQSNIQFPEIKEL
jgi:hypothetical protein